MKVQLPEVAVSISPDGQPTREKAAANRALRIQACALYVSDMHGASIEDIHKLPQFKGVSLSALKTWAKMDDWAGHRARAYEALKERLTKETTSRLTDRLYHETKELLAMSETASSLLKEGKTMPRSWEGVATAKLKIDERLSHIALMMAQGVVDDTGKLLPATAATPKEVAAQKPAAFDASFLQHVVESFHKKQRDELRAALATAPTGPTVIDVQPEPKPSPDPTLIPEILDAEK